MKSLLAITTVLIVSASALVAGENKASGKAGECPQAKAQCASAKATECSKAKAECPKAAAALRTTLLTHKGSLLVQR